MHDLISWLFVILYINRNSADISVIRELSTRTFISNIFSNGTYVYPLSFKHMAETFNMSKRQNPFTCVERHQTEIQIPISLPIKSDFQYTENTLLSW